MFPSLNGDCILVEYVASRYILIDGGYVDTYKAFLLPKLVEIADNGGVIDVLVVTHIDRDHISGIIRMLEEDKLPISIKEIWYNGYKHVQSSVHVSEEDEIFVHKDICKETRSVNSIPISAKQGCTLSTLINRKGLLWNRPANGNTMKGLSSYLLGDATIHILSPNSNDISNVEAFWKKKLIKAGLLSKAHSNEYWDDAFEFSLSQEKPGFHFHEKKVSKSYDLLKIKEETYIPDSSDTNGSSIAFILETEGKRVLFLGDAHAETIVESLTTLYGEKYVEVLISRTAYMNGILYRKQAMGEDYSELYTQIKEIFEYIDFSFEKRIQWERSYLLPEELFPFLYDKLAEIYRDFFVDKIEDFMKHLKSRMPNQLCLYREGYCATLIRMISILGKKSDTRQQAMFLADETVKYILYAVQNRSERCSYLLQICREYAIMGEKTKTQSTYLEVLNSSMGPDWYKEAQLDLINEFRKTDTSFDATQVAHMAAIFEEASGEMTFQRYVQQEKNEFVATIAKASSLSDAIAYYKFETIPSSERIISNAEDWKVDMPIPGNGYDLGANHLIEANAICQLLCECKKVSPYIKYAISELFWENWDKMHNDHQYADLHSEIIAELGEKKSIEILAPRMADYIAHIYDTKKGGYLKDFDETVTSDSFGDSLNYFLEERGIEWKRSLKEDRRSEEGETLKERLGSLPSSKALLDNMRKNIVSPLGSYWYSLGEFITPLINKSDFDKTKLFDIISGHYDINVRPSKQQFEKFIWMSGFHEEHNQDEQMIHFLIWFLVHPDRNISMRAEEALKWLCEYDHRVIKCLIEEIKQNVEIGLNTIASAVLLEIALQEPSIVLEYIQSDDEQKALLNVRSFSVSRNLYEIALVLSERCEYNGLLEKMGTIFPDTMPDRGDVLIDSEDMMFIEHKIDELNNLQVTGRKEFAQPYLDAVHSLKNDGTITRLFKVDAYIRRSFFLNGLPKGRYIRTMGNVLNRVLYGKVDYERARRVYYAIND